jgi:Ran GTPase-activating protein (RanGAP) involved in mRNA processing and transport
MTFTMPNGRMKSAANSFSPSRPLTQSPLHHSILRSGHGVNDSPDGIHSAELPPILGKHSDSHSSKHVMTKLKSIKDRDSKMASKSPNKQIIKKFEAEGGSSFISFIQNATAVRSTANGVLYYQRKMGLKNEELESKMAHAKNWFVDKPVEIEREIRMMKPLKLEEPRPDDFFLTAAESESSYPIEMHSLIESRNNECANASILRALPQIGDKNRRNHVIERLAIDKEAYRPPPPPPPPPPHPLCSLLSGVLQHEGMRLPRKWLELQLISSAGVELVPDGFAEPFVDNMNKIMEMYIRAHGGYGETFANESSQHVSLIQLMDDIFEDFRIGQNLENKAYVYKILYWLPQFLTVVKAPCNGNVHPSRFLWGALSLICICTSSTLSNKSGRRLPTLQEVCLNTSTELLQLLKHMRLDDDVYVQNILESREEKSAPKRNFSCSQSLVATPRELISRQTINAPHTQLMVEEYKERCLSENHAPIGQAIVQMARQGTNECVKTLTLNGYLGGDKCIDQLCTFITVSSKSLETLDLRKNAMSDNCVEGLKLAIMKLRNLKLLNLDYNCLGKKGAYLLANAMKFICSPSTNSKNGNNDKEKMNEASQMLGDDDEIDRKGLAAITISWNKMLDLGCAAICKAALSCPTLTSLDISGNQASSHTGVALGNLFEKSGSLVELRAEWNQFRGKGAAAICAGMISNCNLTHVYLAWNNFGDVNACAAIGHALKRNGPLLHLDLTKNQINGRGAALIAEGLAENGNLHALVLNDNPLGAVGGRLLIRASPKLNKERELCMLNCNASSGPVVKDSAVFDPSQPTGMYELDMSDPYSHIVLKHLLLGVSRNDGIFATQPELEGKRWNPPSAEDLQDEKAKLPDKGILSFKFEVEKKIAGEQDTLSSEDMMMIERLFQLAAKGSDREALIFMITSGNTFMQSDQVASLFQKYMKTPQEQVQLVTKCMFRLADSDAKDLLIDMMSPEALVIFKRSTSQYTRLFTPNNPTGRYKLDMSRESDFELFMKLLDERDIFHREMLRRHKAGRPGDLQCNKATPPEYVFLNLKIDNEGFELPASHFKPEQRGLIEFDFVSGNHVSEICQVASPEEVAQFYAPGSELRRKWFEKQDEEIYQKEVLRFKLEVERKHKTPEQSSIEVDTDQEVAYTESVGTNEFAEVDASVDQEDNIISAEGSDCRPKTSDSVGSGTKILSELHQASKRKKIDLLTIEKYDEWEKQVYKVLRGLCNEKCLYMIDACDIISQIKDSSLRVEAAICMFRRVRDWHGYGHTVFKRLSRTERLEFTRRVGSQNLYDEICAVNYYELNLNNAGDRFVMGELTRLAVLEPGENMIDETYGGLSFELPAGKSERQHDIAVADSLTTYDAGWCTETPNRGEYTTYYCREAVRYFFPSSNSCTIDF